MSKLFALLVTCAPLALLACSSSDPAPSTAQDASVAHDAAPAPIADSAPADGALVPIDTGAPDSAIADAGTDVVVVTGDGGDGISSPNFDGDLIALPRVVQCSLNGISAGKAGDAGAYPNMQIAWAPNGPATTPATYHCAAGVPTATITFQYQLQDGGVIAYTAGSAAGTCDLNFTSAAAASGQRNEGTFTATLTRAGFTDKLLTGGKFGCTVP